MSNLARPCGEFYSADRPAIPTESEGDIEFNDDIDDDINFEFLQESEPLGGQRSTKEETWNSPSATTYEYGQHLDKAGDNQSVAFQNDHEQQNYMLSQQEGLLNEDRNYSTGNHNSSSDASTMADLSVIPTESEGDIEFNDDIDDGINFEFLQESEPLGGQRSTKEETWNSPSATTYEYGQHLDKAGDNQFAAFQNDHEQQNYMLGQQEGLLDEDRNYSTGNHNSSSDASSMADNSQRGLGFHDLPPDHQDFSHNNDQMEEPAVHVDSQERSQDHEEDQNTQSLESEREVFEASGHHAEVQNNQKTGPVVVEWHSFQNKIYHSYSSFRKTYVILGYDSELPRRIITKLEARTWQKVNGQKEVINCSTMLEWTRKDSTSIYTLTSKPTTSQQTLFKTTGKRAICSAKVVPGNRIILTYEWKPTNGFLLFRPEDKETNSFGVSLLYSLDSAGTLCDLDINTPLHILSKLEGTKRKRDIPGDHRIEHEQMQERVKRYCRGA